MSKTENDRVYLVQFNISYDGTMTPVVTGTLITPTKPAVGESVHFSLVREIEAMMPRSYKNGAARYLGWNEIAGYDRIGQSKSFIHFNKAPWLDQ